MICSQCATTTATTEILLEPLPETISKRFQELLASNAAPLGSERESLSDLLSRTQDFAVNLDMRIADLRGALESLLSQKVATEQRLRDLKVTLHPIRTVPPEILAEIFDEAVSDAALVPLETVRNGDFANTIDNSSQSCIVSQVCSAWRRTAMRTQRLWRFVHVSFDRYPRNLSTSIFLNRILARSAEQALHVMLHATVDHPAMTVLLMTSTRWHTSAVSLPANLYYAWNHDLMFQSLTRLHIHVQLEGMRRWQDLRPPQGCRKVRLNLPQLQSFSSDTAGAWSQIMSWGSKYPRLRHFENIGISDARLFTRISLSFTAPLAMVSAPLLTSAFFHLEKPVAETFYNRTLTCPVLDAYPNMRVLRLCGTSPGYNNFFSKFKMPCLEVLSLEDSDAGGEDLAFPSPLVAPTGQHLRELKLPLQNAADTAGLVAFLSGTPKVIRLELVARTHFDISSTVEAVLNNEEGLLPDLTDLVITGTNSHGVAISDRFVEAIRHRRSGESRAARLQEVVVNYVTDVNADVKDAFESLLSGGLRGALELRSDEWNWTAEMLGGWSNGW